MATSYETLRTSVVEGASTGGHFGLVTLLRGGIAAWMTHTSAAPVTASVATARSESMPSTVLDELHAEMVAVLANMVLAVPEASVGIQS